MSADEYTRKRRAEGKGKDGGDDDESKAVPEARAQPKGRTRPGKADDRPNRGSRRFRSPNGFSSRSRQSLFAPPVTEIGRGRGSPAEDKYPGLWFPLSNMPRHEYRVLPAAPSVSGLQHWLGDLCKSLCRHLEKRPPVSFRLDIACYSSRPLYTTYLIQTTTYIKGAVFDADMAR